MRTFDTGATRDSDDTKPDYEGYLSPLVIEAYGAYMTRHRKQADGGLRDSDNWQKGIPRSAYIKSAFRHFIEVWTLHRSKLGYSLIEEPLCALLFNVMGYLHEHLKLKAISEAAEKKLDAMAPLVQGGDLVPMPCAEMTEQPHPAMGEVRRRLAVVERGDRTDDWCPF